MKIFKTIVVLLLANLQILLANAGNTVYSIDSNSGNTAPPMPMDMTAKGGSGGPGSQTGLPIDDYAMLLVVVAVLIIGYLVYSKKYKII